MIYIAIINLILFVTALILAYLSYLSAMKSLAEATKARRDMFLPIITVTKDKVRDIPMAESNKVYFYTKNRGHGIALDPKMKLTGTTKEGNILNFDPILTRMGAGAAGINYLDHTLTPHYIWELDIWRSGICKESLSDMQLIICYKDIFKREIKTTYAMFQEVRDNEKYELGVDLKSIKIKLP